MERTNNRFVITRGTVGDSCYVLVNGSADFDAELDSTFNLACERSVMYRNYYEYMQGLPMKLMDSGTIIDPEVERLIFMGKEYYKLKVTYLEEVGSDVWYFFMLTLKLMQWKFINFITMNLREMGNTSFWKDL